MKSMMMMRKGLCILVCLMPLLAFAQKKDDGNAFDQGIDAGVKMFQGLWNRAQKEGRPFAEKTIKAAPSYYKGVQKSLTEFTKRVEKGDIAKTLDEKRKLVTELWRMRSAINLMALLDPQMLKNLVGIDAANFSEMLKQLKKTETHLSKAGLKVK